MRNTILLIPLLILAMAGCAPIELAPAAPAAPPAAEEAPYASGPASETVGTRITEARAREIALAEVPGKVTDVAIERKFGKTVYVVEIRPTSGPETDVIIDMDTGEVLAVEQ